MIKVTMNLTENDVSNTDDIYRWTAARSKAQAVSTALSLTRFVLNALRTPGTKLLLDTPGGTERVVMPEFDRLDRTAGQAESASGDSQSEETVQDSHKDSNQAATG